MLRQKYCRHPSWMTAVLINSMVIIKSAYLIIKEIGIVRHCATGAPLFVAGSHFGDWAINDTTNASNSSQTLSMTLTSFTLPSAATTNDTFIVPECLQFLGRTILAFSQRVKLLLSSPWNLGIVSFIRGLFSRCSPPTITWFVISIRVYSIYRMFERRFRPHIF